MHHAHHAVVDGLAPLVVAELLETALDARSDGVDEDVELTAPPLGDLVEDPLDLVLVLDVGHERHSVGTAAPTQIRCGAVEYDSPAADQSDSGAVVGQASRRGQAHSASTTDHDRGGVLQPEIHGPASDTGNLHVVFAGIGKTYYRLYSNWKRSPDLAPVSTEGGPAVAKQATAEKRPRRERGSINPDDIIKGAFELAEQVGIDNLSMPLLGKHLGVGVTSIYWYFRKKDDLLNAMTDRALRQYVFATPYVEAKDWRETLANHARTMRKTFMGNPILCDLILIRSALSPRAAKVGVQEVEKAIDSLVEAGLSPEDAFDTYSAVSVHVRGSVVLQRLTRRTAAETARATSRDHVIDPETTPLLAHAGTRRAIRIGAADDHNFEYGLECILDHADRLIERGQDSRAQAPARGASLGALQRRLSVTPSRRQRG